ncbi:MAG: hypothetical protein GXP26_17300 [Planctomycetes bacterium]|nr:hypothetical protein [Planctomycetota bacterium]
MAQRSIGFGRGILFCRWLSPEALGQWEMVYSFLLLAAPLAVLGIPGSFGRYLEHFRQRGHLITFLTRTAAWTVVCGASAVGIVVWFAPQFSHLLFGNYEQERLVQGIALCLAAIILHHALTSLLIALRLFRVVSAMNFVHSMLFAILALGLLAFNASVSSILIGYGVACLVASLGAIAWVGPGLCQAEQPVDILPQSEFWSRMLRFAFFVWLTDMLAHLFAIVDRYMILHVSGMPSVEALQQVGYYHGSRIVPLLLVSFADMFSGMVMPHLSHDWEAGRRAHVGRQVNFSIKLTSLGMVGFGVGVLLFSPLLFEVALAGKYTAGLAVLPWTLTGCVWFGIYVIAQNYLWCAEHARLAAIPLAIGLAVNIGLNILLLPLWGLYGAVVATGISTLVCLAILLLMNQHHGLKLDRGTWLLALLPATLVVGPGLAAAAWVSLVPFAVKTNLIFTNHEHVVLRRWYRVAKEKIAPLLRLRTPTTNPVTSKIHTS